MDNCEVNSNWAPILPMGDAQVRKAVRTCALALRAIRHTALPEDAAERHLQLAVPRGKAVEGA